MIRQETLGAQWDIKAWLKEQKVSIKHASEQAGVSDTIIHVWSTAQRSPFAFWKFCQMRFRTKPMLGILPKLVIPVQPYRVTEPMWVESLKFEQQFKGTSFEVEDGTRHVVQLPSAKALASITAPPAPPSTPEPAITTDNERLLTELLARLPSAAPTIPKVMDPTPARSVTPADDEAIDVLLNLLVSIKSQRDALIQRTYSLESQLQQREDERREYVRLQHRVEELQREVNTFRNLADDATAPGTDKVINIRSRPEAVDRVAGMISVKAPGLLEELRRLPRQA